MVQVRNLTDTEEKTLVQLLQKKFRLTLETESDLNELSSSSLVDYYVFSPQSTKVPYLTTGGMNYAQALLETGRFAA